MIYGHNKLPNRPFRVIHPNPFDVSISATENCLLLTEHTIHK